MAATITLPNELKLRLVEIATAEGRSLSAVVREAAERYVAHRQLDDLAAQGQTRARKNKHRRADVLRFIAESRLEKRG